jgi:hypothetical protein
MCVLLCRDASQAYRQRLIELGYADVAADAEALAKIVEGAKAVADKKKTLSDQDLEALVGDKLYSSPPTCVQTGCQPVPTPSRHSPPAPLAFTAPAY